MDKGAHFYNCDFQVHTPRDINWSGQRPNTTEERKDYAAEFICACRSKNLSAVAITDHHDFTFYEYIKDAARNEIDKDGNPISPERRIVVFPGMELSLSSPNCQAILILDSEFPINLLYSIYPKLGLTPPDTSTPIHPGITKIPHTVISGLDDLYKEFDGLEFLKGRYIVLPNIGKSKSHSLLKNKQQDFYKNMPCVGGYLDGDVSQFDAGDRDKINGRAVEYGKKEIAVFQTSDNRTRTFENLGKYTTWVKWAEPTAEALRQACLAKESRLTLSEPITPQIWITSIDVTNSKFLSTFNFDLNPQYNAIIGGRGTGKSTILEYIRWALCDQPISSYNVEDLSEIERKRQNIILKTLLPYDGEVRISFMLNGIRHIVKRNSKSKEIQLKIGSADFILVKEDDIKTLLPVQAYSQKQLSEVGVKTEELKRFIEKPITLKLNALRFQIAETAIKLKEVYNKLIRKKEVDQEIEKYTLELSSLNNQAESLRSTLKGIEEKDQKIINKKQIYEIEETIITNTKNEIAVLETKVNELIEFLELYPESVDGTEGLENKELIILIEKAARKKYEEIKLAVEKTEKLFNKDNMIELNSLIKQWDSKKEIFEVQYEEAKGKASSNQQQLIEIQRIEKRLNDIKKIIGERRNILKELGSPEIDFEQSKQKWIQYHTDKVNLFNEESIKLSELSKGSIKAEVTKSIALTIIKKELTACFSGTRIREDRIDSLLEKIRESENPIESWMNILAELRLLAEVKISEDKTESLPDTPILSSCEFNDNNKRKICEQFKSDNWLQLLTVELEFDPIFYYSTNNVLSDFILFSEASAGQQATALLTVLLNQQGTPLIIDQPEDDIDNRAIDEIIKNIWEAKKNRQLIFTSHNANLVVNGDAELVICCDNKESGDQTKGIIKAEGAIDSKKVKDEITAVMEGGEKAFILRKDKYGF